LGKQWLAEARIGGEAKVGRKLLTLEGYGGEPNPSYFPLQGKCRQTCSNFKKKEPWQTLIHGIIFHDENKTIKFFKNARATATTTMR